MSANHSTPERAANYFRMSTLKQEDSIDRQRSQVDPYAHRKGYRVVAVYEDPGIPGDEIEKRPQFRRMLQDAKAGKFEVILCDDKDRFGRFDSLTLGEVAAPLRRAGVRLETVAQGLIDWNSFTGRITDAVLQEARRMEAEAISRRVLTDALARAARGEWPVGLGPYGYRVEVVDGLRRLVVHEREAEVVRWIFSAVGERGMSLSDVRDELYRRGVPPPVGNGRGKNKARGLWDRTAIGRMIANRAYVGDLVYNKRRQGKYNEMSGGQVRPGTGRKGNRPSAAADLVICERTHQALVSRETFEDARAALVRGRKRTCPVKGEGKFLLSGLLVCGHCGARMTGSNKGHYRVYYCSTSLRLGPQSCPRWEVREDEILESVTDALQTELLAPERLERVREAIEAELREEQAAGGAVEHLRSQLAEVEAALAKGKRNLGLVDPDFLADLQTELRRLDVERLRLLAELDRLARPGRREEMQEALARAEAQLWQLREALLSSDPSFRRSVLQALVEKVELFNRALPWGKRTRRVFDYGDLTPLDEGFNLLCSAGRVSIVLRSRCRCRRGRS
jgi:site-specific DNA recombinase